MSPGASQSPEETIAFPMTPAERDEICDLADLNPVIVVRIRKADPAKPTVSFTPAQLDYLSSAVTLEASRTQSPGRQRVLDRVVHRIALTVQRAAHERHVMRMPGLAKFLADRAWSDTRADANALVSDTVVTETFNAQIALDRTRREILRIPWETLVSIFLSPPWRQLIVGLASLTSEIRQRIACEPPTRRKFLFPVWQLHLLGQAVGDAHCHAQPGTTKAELGRLSQRLFSAEMWSTGGRGPGFELDLANEASRSALVRLRAARSGEPGKPSAKASFTDRTETEPEPATATEEWHAPGSSSPG
jgi:hypothetical protein